MSRKVALKDEDDISPWSVEEVEERFLIAALAFLSEELLGILQYKLVVVD